MSSARIASKLLIAGLDDLTSHNSARICTASTRLRCGVYVNYPIPSVKTAEKLQ